MVLLLTITLAVSILGIVSILAVKRWEMETGHVLWAGLRPTVGVFLARSLFWIERRAPRLVRELLRSAGNSLLILMHRLVAKGVLIAERGLERTLHLLRHKTDAPRAQGEASAFLREVAEHKKKLLRRPRNSNIFEE